MAECVTTSRPEQPPYTVADTEYLKQLDSLETIIWIYDQSKWRQHFGNKAALKVWQCATLEEFLSKDFRDNSASTEIFLNALVDSWKSEIGEGKPSTVKRTNWTIYPKGKPVMLHLACSPHVLPSSGRIIIKIEGMAPDSNPDNQRGLEAFRHSSNLVHVYNLNGMCLLQNAMALSRLRHPDGSFVIQPDAQSLSEATFLRHVKSRTAVEKILGCVLDGKDVSLQLEVSLQVGERHHVIHALRILDPTTGEHLVMIEEQDVTETVMQQREIIAYKLSSQLKDQFLANTTHELKTPLHGIIGLAESLLEETSDNWQRDLQMIVSCGRRLTNMVENILDLSVLRDGISLRVFPVRLLPLAEEIYRLSEPLVSPNVKLQLSIPTEACVMADDVRLKQILHNLVGNALKFTQEGKVEIAVEPSARANYLTVKVVDSGPGIPAEAVPKLAQPFFQVDASIKRIFGGSGLGLAITKRLLDLHGSKLQIESTIGKGSTFSFELPVATTASLPRDVQSPCLPELSSASPATLAKLSSVLEGTCSTLTTATSPHVHPARKRLTPPPTPAPIIPKKRRVEPSTVAFPNPTDAARSHLSYVYSATSLPATSACFGSIVDDSSPSPRKAEENGFTVLSVDDDPVCQLVLQNILKKHGYRVVQVMTGADALSYLRSFPLPDMVLLDLHLFDMSGFEILDTIRSSISSTIPVIVLSAAPRPAQFAGAQDWLTKPFKSADVLHRIEELLPEKRPKMMVGNGPLQPLPH
jgi:signal transduction histidine kinase/CheY-like chemotaxis protein